MSRYIDADALLKNVDKYPYAQGLMDLIADIQTAPSIDIVHCGECTERDDDWCMYFGKMINPDDFCSYGERREP